MVFVRPQLVKSVVKPLRFAGACTTASMLRVSAELAALAQAQGDKAHAEHATSMGLANFQLALALVGMMTAPNSSAQRQLLNHVTGGVTPEHVVKALQDPKYVTMIWTFDQHAEEHCEGTRMDTRMDTPLAELTKQRMLAIAHPGTLQIESRGGNPNDCVDEINKFCNKGTNGMIPQIVTELDPCCVAVLLCCVYLKVSWVTEGKRLPPAPFYAHPGSQSAPRLDLSESPYGTASGRRSVYAGIGGQLLSKQRYFTYSKQHFDCWWDNVTRVYWLMLECKTDEETGDERFMLYGLPHPDSADPENDMYASMASLSTNKFVNCKFDTVVLPCVDVGENKLDGKDMLKKNGVLDIFNNVKALPMMFWSPKGNAGVVVSRIIHKSKIKWDEKGAVAAAATLVEFVYRSLGAVEIKNEFVLNRPGVALLCKKLPKEDANHLTSDQRRQANPAGMVCEFVTLIKGQLCADVEGSMGDFSEDKNKPVGGSDEDFFLVDVDQEQRHFSRMQDLLGPM